MALTNGQALFISNDPNFRMMFDQISVMKFPEPQLHVATMYAMIKGAEWALNYAEELVTKTLSSDGDIDFLDFMIQKGWGLYEEDE